MPLAIAERGYEKAIPLGEALYRSPTTGIASCCPRATSGHAAAAPPRSVMKSRRRMPDTRASPLAVGPPHHQPTTNLMAGPLGSRCIRVLHFQPIRRAAGTVGGILPLRHDTFEPHLAGVGEDGRVAY